MNEAIAGTIAHLQAGMKPLEDQLAAKKKLINSLLAEVGEPPIYTDVDSASASTSGPVRPDQYFGRPMATVVREILERRKAMGQGAISLNDLYVSMKAGGFEFPTKDETNAKTGVATSLGKNPAFIKVPSTGFWGLLEWYPGAKRNKSADGDGEKDKPNAKDPAKKDDAPNPEAGKTEVVEL